MRTARRRSFRLSLYGMLVVPVVSLITLWGFAAQSTASEALHQRNIDTANEVYGNAVQPMLVTVAQERQESVVWLAGRGRLPRTSLDAVRKKADGTIVQMNKAANSGRFRGTLTGPMKQRLSVLIGKLNAIAKVRGEVDSGALTKLEAFNAYNDIIDSHFRFIYLLVADNGYQQAYHLTGMSRAIELSGREATLVGGVLVGGGRMTPAEYAAINQLVYERRYLQTTSLSEFTPGNGAPFRQALASPPATTFTSVEDRILAAGPKGRLTLPPAAWEQDLKGFIGALDGALLKSRTVLAGDAKKTSDRTLWRLGLVGGLGLVAVLLTLFLVIRFARRIGRDLLGLQSAARSLAEERLPGLVGRLSRGDEVDVAVEAPPLRLGKTAEVANVADAFSSVQRTAVAAAVGQADLRKAVNQVFQNMARRNQSLLHRQLAMLDTLERKATDPEALADLFAIDHLTTRMRRQAEGLVILSGAAPGRGWRHPVSIVDVLRGAVGEIEDYSRVDVVTSAQEGIVGAAVADVIHLMAELIENAAAFSPPNTPVEVDAGLVGQGFVVEIQDRGLGMAPEKLAAINQRLSREPEFDLADGDQLGLFVVTSLAYRHGIRVVLEPNAYGGIKTIVLLPHSLVVPADRIGREAAEAAPGADPAAANAPANAPAMATARPGSQDPAYPAQVPAGTGGFTGTGPMPVSGTGPMSVTGTGPLPVAGHVLPGHAQDPSGRHRLGGNEPGPGDTPSDVPPSAPPPPPRPAPDAPASQVGDTHAGMPRRVRRANLAPQLRDAPPSPRDSGEQRQPGRGTGRSPERARSVMTSMQSGWRRGRVETSGPVRPNEDEENR
ncbi:sensor histidine kinase [Actinomadura nitritigenes]|uniref:histidine kinase n=1 Tax=Actinomadura nitritigenes TaxID=134602 RepID=A0ABS3QUZ0_9ACTN|nr:nitrate- and nitrite sensing domain-containing protein [Actinomadura nitritigenes]MBO2437790.1 sensor histidine kinase [Actinomadura nitritigenes]